MRHRFDVFFETTRKLGRASIRALVKEHPGVYLLDGSPTNISSDTESVMRAFYRDAVARGHKCSYSVVTYYDASDALSGALGYPSLGMLYGAVPLKAHLPSDAFDFSTGCVRCGLGAAQPRPRVIADRSVGHKSNMVFSTSPRYGDSGLFLRSHIGREIIEATGQPWCMRHPVTRDGRVVKEWMEPVPCATLPPLSRKSEGVLFGASRAIGDIGEPERIVPPCPACGRVVWGKSEQRPLRLVYSKAAIEAAQRHAVTIMYEPQDVFPEFDPASRIFKSLYGLPGLLYNHAAIEVLARYVDPTLEFGSSCIAPVFSE